MKNFKSCIAFLCLASSHAWSVQQDKLTPYLRFLNAETEVENGKLGELEEHVESLVHEHEFLFTFFDGISKEEFEAIKTMIQEERAPLKQKVVFEKDCGRTTYKTDNLTPKEKEKFDVLNQKAKIMTVVQDILFSLLPRREFFRQKWREQTPTLAPQTQKAILG